jgi:hypothetical protein
MIANLQPMPGEYKASKYLGLLADKPLRSLTLHNRLETIRGELDDDETEQEEVNKGPYVE